MKEIFFTIIIVVMSIVLVLMGQTTIIASVGQQNNASSTILNPSPMQTNITSEVNMLKNFRNDITPPSVNITNPDYPPTITTDKIIIQGTANDSESGIHNVSAAAYTFPFKNNLAVPLLTFPSSLSLNNWSHWSVPLIINTPGPYRIVIEARDSAGNPGYAETTINPIIPEKNLATGIAATEQIIPKIAFVRPTFTEAAYQERGFYRFYFKYDFPPFGKNITTDLDMLTVKTPRSVSEFQENDPRHLSPLTSLIPINGTELDDISYYNFPDRQNFWMPFIDHLKKDVPNAVVTVMRDEDVHDGHIFYADNKTNAYDVLLLFHNEYVTQKEYDNLREFVKNGGTIVFIDSNILYAEVSYDKDNHEITLVKGHDWVFNGEAARKSVSERWFNETKDWVGGNYLVNSIVNNVTFTNNPFNYTHFEESYVNNPKAKIIIDYGITFPPKDYLEDPSLKEKKVATYTLNYGKGKVIMLGLKGQNLVENETFLDFFDYLITNEALCSYFERCNMNQTAAS